MPKHLAYPRASFKNALALADAVNTLGGDCTANTCAEKMNYKGGSGNGAFNALTGAAVKYGLVTSKSETLVTTELYRNIALAYNEAEKQLYRQSAFLTPPLHRTIYEKFRGKELPVNLLDRLLIREYDVDKATSSRVAGYIVEGARFVGLLIDNRFVETVKAQDESNVNAAVHREAPATPPPNQPTTDFDGESGYVLQIIGPDMNSRYKIQDEDDFIIIEAILRKLKRKLGVA